MRMVLLLGTFAVLGLVLTACALRLRSGMPTGVSAAFDGTDGILYVAGADVKRLDLKTGTVQSLLRTDREVLRALRDGEGRLVFEARTETPRGRPTIQPFVQSGGKLVPLLPADESMRSGLTIVEGVPTYVKRSEWRGAFGGTPWDGEGALCQIVDGRERTILAPLRRTADTDATTYGAVLPFSYYADTHNGPFALALANTERKTVREIGRYAYISHPALSPDGSKVALSKWDAVVEVEAGSGRSRAEYPVEARVIGVMYAPSGELYALFGEANSGEAELRRIDHGRFEPVTILR